MATPELNLDPNSFLQEQSWHLLSILLQIGHPVDAEYLSSRCGFFNASADFVRYVASLPDSLLAVNSNGLLTPSVKAVLAIARFFSFQVPNSAPSFSRKRKSVLSLTEGTLFFLVWILNCLFSYFDFVCVLEVCWFEILVKTGGRDPKRFAIGDKVPEILVKVVKFIIASRLIFCAPLNPK